MIAKEYATALVGSLKHEKRLVDVEERFEDVRAHFAQPLVEYHSAQGLLEYMKD